jgi:two-component sensor histidine kinase
MGDASGTSTQAAAEPRPPFGLGTRTTKSRLSMALHELATNAVKYGAFSNANGTVEVDWNVGEDGQFALRWMEEGGPPVSLPGKRGVVAD